MACVNVNPMALALMGSVSTRKTPYLLVKVSLTILMACIFSVSMALAADQKKKSFLHEPETKGQTERDNSF